MHHQHTTRRAIAAALLVLTPLAAIACGEEKSDTPADATTTSAAMKDSGSTTGDSMSDSGSMTGASMKDGDSMGDSGSMTGTSMMDGGH